MERLGGFIERIGLAMAGKRNPWGKPSGGGGNDGGDDGGEGSGPDDGDTPSSSGGNDGPRNPWLPGGGGGKNGANNGERPRRSANIEDIFRNRGPEGPRRGGSGGGGSGFQMPELPGGRSWFPIAIVAILGVWFFTTSLHQVQPEERGFKTWLGGQYAGDLQAGLNYTFPYPIQTVDIENTNEVRQKPIPESGENLILTGDQNLVDLSYLVRWRITDLVQYRFELLEPEETVTEVAESAMRAAVAETTLDNILSGAGRAEAELRVRTRMQTILDAYGAGIQVVGVSIERTEAPEQVIDAFNDVLAARQNREQALNEARRYEQQILAQAQGSAAEFNEIYGQYRLAPEVTRRRLYYETMEQVLRGTDKTIIEADGVVPYLPLPEVRRRAQSGNTLTVTPQEGQ